MDGDERNSKAKEGFLGKEMPKLSLKSKSQGKGIPHPGNSMCKGHKGRGISLMEVSFIIPCASFDNTGWPNLELCFCISSAP